MRHIKALVVAIVALAAAYSPQKSQAQIYNGYYAMYCGIGYMPLATGYYYGWIQNGFPQGEGYIYYYDPYIGWMSYHGGFLQGVAHGAGELLCSAGYIAGVWNYGQFVQQNYVSDYQVQQSAQNISQTYRNNVQTQNNIQSQLPRGTRITQIDSDSELGRQILGKIQ